MAMRYIIRRSNPEDLISLKKDIPQLDSQLEKASDGLRRIIPVTLGNLDRINYLFLTQKKGTDWIWTCPSAELVAENEQGLFSLMERLQVQPPAHLAHLKN
jgi:hypothetical protein